MKQERKTRRSQRHRPERWVMVAAMGFRTVAVAALAISATLGSIAGCSGGSNADDPPCPAPRPAFTLEVIRKDGIALPADLELMVTYGSGEESFRLAGGNAASKAVFCKAFRGGSEVALPAPTESAPTSIKCDLWTAGAAKLRVTAKELETLEEQLTAETNDCGVVTKPHISNLLTPSQSQE